MPKKFQKKKKGMVNGFLNGKTILELSEIFNCSKTTISRHLKNILGNKFKDLNKVNGQKIQLEKIKKQYDNLRKKYPRKTSFEKLL